MGSYGIIWNDELDIETETIYEEGQTVRRVRPAASVMAGSEVAKARAKMGLSQKELSEKTGIDQSDISKIERGVANPSIATLTRIAEELGAKLIIRIE